MKKLFLSYRRDDVPGYVARLEDELERAFGANRVFRDVEDIAGGAEWKQVLDQNLAEAGALILIIGPRWAEIWSARHADPVNYVAFELQRARELGVPVIPVTVNHASLPLDLDLGELAWLRDRQFYDVSDVQNRWKNDVQGLIDTLARVPQIGPPIGARQTAPEPDHDGNKGMSKPLGIGIGLVVVVALAGFVFMQQPAEQPAQQPPVQTNAVSVTPPARAQAPDPAPVPSAPVAQRMTYPDISGTWISTKDGTAYFVDQRNDGSFSVTSPGYGNGEGVFSTTMPRKFSIEMHGIGRGEFSVSNSDDSASGWLMSYETREKEYDTLQRIR